MKLLWFHLMPYTELPDDFREKNPSVWVDIDSSLFDPRRAHHMYNDFMDELEFASQCGLDGVCVNEHHSNGYGLMPSPNLIASTLARRTQDTAICVMGNSLALYNPPTRVAEEFAMLDCISGGRLIAGFPVGSPMDTCYAFGQNPSLLRPRYHEAHDLIIRAWTTPEPFAFNGRFNQQRYVNIWPRPIQEPHPPIWIPGGGSVETWQWCAKMDYVYSYLSYFGYKAGRRTVHGFWKEMDRLGKDRNPYRAGFLQFVGVAESGRQAKELYREAAEYFYGRCLHVDARFAAPPGYTTEATVRARVESQVVKAASSAIGRYDVSIKFDEILEKGYVIVGTPDEVAERLRELALDLNVGQLMMLLQYGNMPKDLVAYNTKLFAEEVMPQISGSSTTSGRTTGGRTRCRPSSARFPKRFPNRSRGPPPRRGCSEPGRGRSGGRGQHADGRGQRARLPGLGEGIGRAGRLSRRNRRARQLDAVSRSPRLAAPGDRSVHPRVSGGGGTRPSRHPARLDPRRSGPPRSGGPRGGRPRRRIGRGGACGGRRRLPARPGAAPRSRRTARGLRRGGAHRGRLGATPG